MQKFGTEQMQSMIVMALNSKNIKRISKNKEHDL